MCAAISLIERADRDKSRRASLTRDMQVPQEVVTRMPFDQSFQMPRRSARMLGDVVQAEVRVRKLPSYEGEGLTHSRVHVLLLGIAYQFDTLPY